MAYGKRLKRAGVDFDKKIKICNLEVKEDKKKNKYFRGSFSHSNDLYIQKTKYGWKVFLVPVKFEEDTGSQAPQHSANNTNGGSAHNEDEIPF